MQSISNLFDTISRFMTRHKKLSMLLGAVVLCGGLMLCWHAGVRHEAPEVVLPSDIPSSAEALMEEFPRLAMTERDMDDELDQAEKVSLMNHQGGFQITRGGNYRLTGEMEGTLTIQAPEEIVHLFLDDATIEAVSGSAINCVDAEKLIITLLPGTENSISDSGDYHNTPELEACVFSACDLTINGTGTLNVDGYYKDAIRSKDVVKIVDGNYSIKCKRTAVHGNDGIHAAGGKMVISTEKNGFKTTKRGEENRGALMLSGGEFTIIAGEYAFVTTKANIYIFDCTVRNRSIIDTYNAGGTYFVEGGCVQ